MALTAEQRAEIKKKLLAGTVKSSSSKVADVKARLLASKEKDIAPVVKQKAVVPWSEVSDKPRSTLSFLPRAAADLFTKSSQAFGKTLGAALSVATGETKKQDAAAVSEADSRLKLAQIYNRATPEQKKHILAQLKGGTDLGVATENNADLMKTNRQVFGEGIGTGLEMLQGGGLSKAGSIVKGARTGAATLRSATLSGAKIGAVYGGAGSASRAMQENKSAGRIVGETALGTVVGAGTGALTGAGLYKLGEGPRVRAEQKSLLRQGRTDSRVAGLKLEGAVPDEAAMAATRADDYTDEVGAGLAKLKGGKVVADPTASEVIRQGVDPKSVALIKSGNATDKSKMSKMLDIRELQKTDASVQKRATDVVGDTFVEKVAKPLQKLNKDAGAKLDTVAKSLQGKKADMVSPVRAFADQLENANVTVDRATGRLDFDGSEFEGLAGPQKTITDAWNRALKVAKSGDAYAGHTTKRYIDNIVDYGVVEGQQGNAERIVKNYRHELDTVLDTTFKDYNEVNTQFSETIQALEKMAQEMGTKFRIGDDFAGTSAGVTFRRLFGQGPARAGLLQMLAETEKVAMKYGVKSNENIQAQARFAVELEKLFGSEAPTSLGGTMETAGEQALGAGLQALQSPKHGVINATMGLGKAGLRAIRGINEEALAKALRELLR